MLTTSDPATSDRDRRRLRSVLMTNATTSGVGGLLAVAFAGPLDGVLGTGSPGWVRLVGAGLVVFAVFVLWVSRSAAPRLLREVPSISAGDAGWVVGTVVAIALGWFSVGGAVLMGVVGALVGTFAIAQAMLVRRLGSD